MRNKPSISRNGIDKKSSEHKQRVGITYTSSQRTQEESVELPLKLLVTGDFGENTVLAISERERVSVDHRNFNRVMAQRASQVTIQTPNMLAPCSEPPISELTLNFKAMEDFHPDYILRQMPLARQLLQFRHLCAKLKQPGLSKQDRTNILDAMRALGN